MDIRITKTKNGITNAFIELRAKKPLEKITVKELCELAMINKSTFYKHFTDIYDLSDALETEVVNSVLENLLHPEYILTNPAEFTKELFYAYLSQDSLLQILFSGNRSEQLISKINIYIKEMVLQNYPESRDNLMVDVILTNSIYGGYYAFSKNRQYEDLKIIETIGKLAELSLALLE